MRHGHLVPIDVGGGGFAAPHLPDARQARAIVFQPAARRRRVGDSAAAAPLRVNSAAPASADAVSNSSRRVIMRGDQKDRRRPNCSLRIAWAVRITPKVVDVAPEGTAAPGCPRLTMLKAFVPRPEAQYETLFEMEVARDGQIDGAISRTVEDVAPGVAVDGDPGAGLF